MLFSSPLFYKYLREPPHPQSLSVDQTLEIIIPPPITAAAMMNQGGGELGNTNLQSAKLQWGFIRRVYAIVGCQALLCVLVGMIFIWLKPNPHFLYGNSVMDWVWFILATVSPLLITGIPLIILREKKIWNVIFLVLYSCAFSCLVGWLCRMKYGCVAIEAAMLITLGIVNLILYTEFAGDKGYEFKFLEPFLFAASLMICFYVFSQIFHPLGKIYVTIFSAVIAIFSIAVMVYDTGNWIKRYSYDQYLMAAISFITSDDSKFTPNR